MQSMLRTVVGMLAGAALVILIMVAAGVRAQDGGVQTLAGETAPAQTTIVDGVLAASTSMQYQGVLLDPATGQPKPDGTYNMTFRLYNTGGGVVWLEQQSVPVKTGMFSVLLGSVTPLNASDFNGQELSLGVTVGSDAEMFPRQPIARVPYAFQALNAQTATTANTATTATTANAANNANNLCSSGGVCKDYRNTVFSYGIVGSNGSIVNAFHLGSSSFDGTQYKFRLKESSGVDVNYDPTRHVVNVTPYCNDQPGMATVFAVQNDPNVFVRVFDQNGNVKACALNVSAFYVQP